MEASACPVLKGRCVANLGASSTLGAQSLPLREGCETTRRSYLIFALMQTQWGGASGLGGCFLSRRLLWLTRLWPLSFHASFLNASLVEISDRRYGSICLPSQEPRRAPPLVRRHDARAELQGV